MVLINKEQNLIWYTKLYVESASIYIQKRNKS